MTPRHEEEPHVTMRVWLRTRKHLRRIKAESGEEMVEILERLAAAEWDRIRKQRE